MATVLRARLREACRPRCRPYRTLIAALYAEEPEQVAVYRDGFDRLRAAALSVEESMERIAEIGEKL
ncbi:Scr1 family TA system antitoxin-like transcriptional regulator [Streptomyces sp. NPDC055078]